MKETLTHTKIYKKKYVSHAAFSLFAVLFVVGSIFSFNSSFVYAATYNFVQSSWSGGTDGGAIALHASNQSNWTKYSTASSTIVFNPGGSLSLSSTTSSNTQTSDTDFNAGSPAFSATAVLGAGSGASVALSAATTTAVNSWDTPIKATPGPTGAGSSLIRDSSDYYNMYLTLGGSSTGFYKYHATANTWTALAPTPGPIGAGSQMLHFGASDLIYLTQGGNARGFYEYTISTDTWRTLDITPGNIGANQGNALIRNGSDDYIYAMAGGSSNAFYRYSIPLNQWTTRSSPSVSAMNGQLLRSNGTDDTIYATQGNGATGFMKYSITNDQWTLLASTTGAVGVGSSMIRNGTDDTIYLACGNACSGTGFYSYSIMNNQWNPALAPIPAGISDGSHMIRDGASDFIYLTQGNGSRSLFRYSISLGTWSALPSLPSNTGYATTVTTGSSMLRLSGDDYIFVTAQGGYGGNGFWRYSISNTSWVGQDSSNLATPPFVTNGPGSSAIRNGNEDLIYLTQGANATGFASYSISTNTWSTLTSVGLSSVGAGSSMIRNGSEDYIYLTRGASTTEFYRYTISTKTWTSRAPVPGPIGQGSQMIRNGSDDLIYLTQGGGGTGFYAYSISNNNWTTVSLNPSPQPSSFGTSMIRNGSDDLIYFLCGSNCNTGKGFYQYSISNNLWTQIASTTVAVGSGATLIRNGSEDSIYLTQGAGGSGFYRYSIVGNNWTTLSSTPFPGASGSIFIRPDGGDYIYWSRGASGSTFARYAISNPGAGWTVLGAVPISTADGSETLYAPGTNEIYLTTGAGSSNPIAKYIISSTQYNSSGTYTSGAIDFGAKTAWSTLTWNATLNGQTVSLKVRSSPTSSFSTPFSSCTSLTSGSTLASGGCVTNGDRYLQYQVTLSTSNTTKTPTFDDVTFIYSQYGTGVLTSSIYDSGDANNLVTNVRWQGTGTSSTEILQFQVRSAATSGGIASADWCGPADTSVPCSGTSYFTDPNGGTVLPTNNPLRSGGDDRYFQYRAVLISGGAVTPTLTQATVQYVVNAAPDFDASYGTNGVVVSQNAATSTNPGAVTISYKVRDIDTSTGTVSPGFITPSFEYNTGSGWVAIPSNALLSSDTVNKAVDGSIYATYTATWFATSTIPNTYSATVQVRVTANDNEGANNIARAASAAFTLDTKQPFLTVAMDSSSNLATISVTDDSELQYRLCNDPAFPTTDAQSNSCAWTTLGGAAASSTVAWVPTLDTLGNASVYVQAKDALGNVTAQTVIVPATPTSFDIKDISNPITNSYKEFLSWGPFVATTSTSFGAYKIYTSTDDVTYAPLTTITNSALNYYPDLITTATTSTHYYKVVAVSAQGNISGYTTVLSDVPNGQGGTDTTAPVINPASIIVPGATLKNTSAAVTFSTDELANGSVQYKQSGDSSWTTVTSLSYVLAHNIYLQNLTPNTTYNIQVSATDVVGNVSNYVPGPDFTTAGGPVITNVTQTNLTDNSVTITWNTATSSDSYVYYSTNADMTASLSRGNASQVSCIGSVCQHKVDITSLTPATTYFYYVQSTDGAGNSSVDNNAGANYSFHTTLDLTPPVITDITQPVISSNAAVIVWQTDKPSTTQIAWGTSSGALTRTTVLNTVKTVYHVVALSPETNDSLGATQTLTPETSYFFQAISVDAAGNTGSSTEQTFKTVKTGDVFVVANSGSGWSTSGANANPTSAPVIQSVSANSPAAFTSDLKVQTDKDVTAFVQYGPDTNYGFSAGDPVFTNNKTITLKRLTEGTTYHFKVTVFDQYGNFASSADQTFKTTFVSELLDDRTLLEKTSDIQDKIQQLIESSLPSLAPPFITDPVVSSTTEDGATVTWKTNIKANGGVRYATDADFSLKNDYGTEISSTQNDLATTHSVALTGLLPNTLYHIQARSYVFPQVVGKSADLTFSTKAAPVSAGIASVKKDGFTVIWQTTEPTTSTVEYVNQKTGSINRIAEKELKTTHSVQIQNLPSGVTYSVSVSGTNAKGNTVHADKPLAVTTSVDITPPVISNFKVDNALVPGRAGFIQTVVGWQTDKPSNSAVYYEEGAGGSTGTTKELANNVQSLDAYTLSHVIILPNLRAGTVYRIKVVSTDQSGNIKTFGPTSIITPMQTQSVLDIIVKNFEDTFQFLGAKR